MDETLDSDIVLTHEHIQGSREWLAFRQAYYTASDAGAMLGVSPYKTRGELLREKATGLIAEVDAATQARFDAGHRFEELCRPMAEEIIGEQLFRAVMSRGKLAASFDGITMLEDVIWEHKTLNSQLKACSCYAELPLHYRAQIEQALYVSGAERCLFMASRWRDDGTLDQAVYIWCEPDLELRTRIIDGWRQFERDLANWQPTEAAPIVLGRTPETLPPIRIEITGQVMASNLTEYKSHALSIIEGLNVNLRTDNDFADAEKAAKWCKQVEDRLEAAKQHALSQVASIDELFRTLDAIREEARNKRLLLEKLIKSRKDEIKEALIIQAQGVYAKHFSAVTEQCGMAPQASPPAFAGAIKGLKTLSSMQEAIDVELADACASLDRAAVNLMEKLTWYRQAAAGYEFLFPDIEALINRPLDQVQQEVMRRLDEHAHQTAAMAPAPKAKTKTKAKPDEPKLLSISDINARLKFMVTAPFLRSLGFNGQSNGGQNIYYPAEEFGPICQAIANYVLDLAR